VTNGTVLSRCDRNRNDRLARLRVLLPRSDGVGEFVEDRCERVLSVEIHAEFVVATAKI
jgi:hypothetical protein